MQEVSIKMNKYIVLLLWNDFENYLYRCTQLLKVVCPISIGKGITSALF